MDIIQGVTKMIACQSYVFLIVIAAVSLGLAILVKAILLAQQPATAASAASEPSIEFDPALLLSKSGKPLAGAALQNRLEALSRRQRQGKPLESQ